MKVAMLIGAFAVGAIAGIDYPHQNYVIHNAYGFDVVTITRYVHVGSLDVTVSRVAKAKISCFDLTFEPATILQSCRNTR